MPLWRWIFNISTGSGRAPVTKVGELPYYLAVTNRRPELLEELNAALVKLNKVEPFFRQNLQYANYRNSLISHTLSPSERAWIQEHDVMNVGYFGDYMPYCGSDRQGKATGLLTDVMAEILRKLEITDQLAIRYTPYRSYEEMVADLHAGKLDAAFPVGGELWHGEQDGVFSSSPVVAAGVDLAFAGSYGDNTVASIAVNRNMMQPMECKPLEDSSLGGVSGGTFARRAEYICQESACFSCVKCMEGCPTKAIFLHRSCPVIAPCLCVDCGWCQEHCPVGAILRTVQLTPV